MPADVRYGGAAVLSDTICNAFSLLALLRAGALKRRKAYLVPVHNWGAR